MSVNKNVIPIEDTVECRFIVTAVDPNQELLEKLCEDINTCIESISKDYIWHRDEFKIHIPIINDNKNDIPHLASKTCFGDNIEDEWFIVYIVFQITKQFNNIVVQINDNDGDFLLIEVADLLPKWANPDTTENRVFIYDNHIHIIPPNLIDLDETVELSDAIKIISHSPEKSQATKDIEMFIHNRIGTYPEKALQNIHRAIVKLPVEIAALLALKPKFIAPITSAYCCHDPIDAKAFRNISYENCVPVSLKFTKCLYAMLTHSKLVRNIRIPTQNDKQAIMGLKLACGFKLIMNQSTDLYSTKEFLRFVNNLQKNGYFRNNLEGSEQYKELLNKAKEYFSVVECPFSSSIANEMNELMSKKEFEVMRETLLNDKSSSTELTEDSEDWLKVNPDQLNTLLNSRYGKQTKFEKNDIISQETITTELSNFLKQTSNLEGIETHSEDQSTSIEFKPDEFLDSLEKMMNLLSSNNCDGSSESDFSDEDISQYDMDTEIDQELKCKLKSEFKGEETILSNIVQSLKEEKASSGPSSNLLSSVGLNKTDLLDSDDD